MTFNEGMQIDTSATSSSGGGGRRVLIGGGLGGLLILIVGLFLGVDPANLLSSDQQAALQQSTPGFDLSQCRTGAEAIRSVQCRVVATSNSVDAVWSQLLGPSYRRPHVQLFSGQVDTGCGMATSAVGPFYCPVDSTAYFDTDFFQVLVDQYGSSGGPFAQEYVVAHEFGHHVQNLLGDIGRAQQGAQGATGNGVRTELQADCYAGVWAHYASTTRQQSTGVPFLNPLTDKNISDALSAAAAVGDDRIQKQATGRINPELWTHGSSAERQKSFTTGYTTGDRPQCDTYDATDLG